MIESVENSILHVSFLMRVSEQTYYSPLLQSTTNYYSSPTWRQGTIKKKKSAAFSFFFFLIWNPRLKQCQASYIAGIPCLTPECHL